MTNSKATSSKTLNFVISLVLLLTPLFAIAANSPQTASFIVQPSDEQSIWEVVNPEYELIELRTEFQKGYLYPDGTGEIIVAAYPIHVQNEAGTWVESESPLAPEDQTDQGAAMDTYTQSNYRNNPPGNQARTYLGLDTWGSNFGQTRSFIKFDIPSLPPNSTINSATMNLYQYLGGGYPAQRCRVAGDWGEYTLTYNIAINLPITDCQGYQTVSTGAGYKAWDITNYVLGWRNGSYANYGLRLNVQNENAAGGVFYSRDCISQCNNGTLRPYMRVIYTVSATPTPTVPPPPTYSISGRIVDNSNNPIAGVLVTASGGVSATTNANGDYTITNLLAGTYTLTPNKAGYAFTPNSRSLTISANATGQNFQARLVPSITISPASVVANNQATATITLSGIQPGQRIRLISSRKSIDTFGVAEGVVNANTQFVTSIRSGSIGNSIITAINLSQGGASIPVSAQISFTNVPAPPPPPSLLPRITKVSSSFDSSGVSGQYPLEIGSVNNKINVIVDWQGNPPGHVKYSFRNSGHNTIHNINGNSSQREFDFSKLLRPGCNILTITAVSSNGKSSVSKVYQVGAWSARWLIPTIASLPLNKGNGEIAFRVHYPADRLYSPYMADWLPNKKTRLGPQTVGTLVIPLTVNGIYEMGLGRRYERPSNTPGPKPPWAQGRFQILGKNDVEIDLIGLARGSIGSCGNAFLAPPNEVKISANGKITFKISEKALVVIRPTPPGTAINSVVSGIKPLNDWFKARAQFYLAFSLGAGGDVVFKWHKGNIVPSINRANVYLQGELEAGLKIDLYVVDGKVYILGGMRLEFQAKPNLSVDCWKIYGEIGYEIRAAWFKQSAKWPLGSGWKIRGCLNSMASDHEFSDMLSHHIENWGFIPRPIELSDSIFVAKDASSSMQNSVQEFELFSTNPISIVANIYQYAEPTIVLRSDNHAMLTWVHDDIERPLGQGYNLVFTHWNGLAWSYPSNLTLDNYPDGAPQVAWLPNNNAIAVWESLNDLNLSPDATLDLTTTQKMEVAWAQYNSSTNTWNDRQWLTLDLPGNSRNPRLSHGDNNTLWATWRSNLNGSPWGSEEDLDIIQVAQWGSTNWQTPQTIATDIPGVIDLTMAHDNNRAIVAWTVQKTSVISATPTLQIFASEYDGNQWNSIMRLTDDDLGHTRLSVVYLQNIPYFVWLADNELRIAKLQDNALISVGSQLVDDTFQIYQITTDVVANNNLVIALTGQQDRATNIYLMVYDNVFRLLGKPQLITDDNAIEDSPVLAINNTGQVWISYARTPLTYEVETVIDPDYSEPITYTVPVEGQPDLYVLTHSLRTNLTAESIQLEEVTEQLADTYVLTATIRNTGDLPIASAKAIFMDNGQEIASFWLNSPLGAGDAQVITTTYMPQGDGIRLLSVFADPDNEIAEDLEDDNQQFLSAFGADLKFDGFNVEYWGGSEVGINIRIANVGDTDSLATDVHVYSEFITGTLLLDTTIPAVPAGEVVSKTVSWNFGELPLGLHTLVGAVNTQLSFPELITENNYVDFSLPVYPNLLLDGDSLQTTPILESTVNVTFTLYNVGHITVSNVLVAGYSKGTFGEDSLLFTVPVETLAPASGITLNQQVDQSLHCGLYLVADPYFELEETTRADNVIAVFDENALCADFWPNPYQGIAPLTVDFEDTSSGSANSWSWDFGDGNLSTEQSPTHTFEQPGVYTTTMSVTGVSHNSVIQRTIHVYQKAEAGFNMSVSAGLTPLTVSFVNLSQGDYDYISWDFGDDSGSSEANPTYVYEKPGIYSVTLTVDGLGGTSEVTKTIVILQGHHIFLPLISTLVSANS